MTDCSTHEDEIAGLVATTATRVYLHSPLTLTVLGPRVLVEAVVEVVRDVGA